MLAILTINNYGSIEAKDENNKIIGSVIDSCCGSIVSFAEVSNFIKIEGKTGNGGFLKHGYTEVLKEIWVKAWKSNIILEHLKKNVITITYSEMTEGKYIEKLKKYDENI